MNLIIDIGNTRVKLVAFEGSEPQAEAITGHDLEGLKEFVCQNKCQRGIVSSTARPTERLEEELAAMRIPLIRLSSETPLPIKNCYRTPHTLGTDRLAAIAGAWSVHPERNILVVDAGTCVTYDFIDAEGNYRGGNISPGLEMRLKAMHQQTARLPMVDSEGEIPEMGYDTETAMRSGVFTGIRHEIEGYIRHFRQKYADILIFLTGGNAINLDMSKENCIFVPENNVLTDEWLVARGLNYILEYNT